MVARVALAAGALAVGSAALAGWAWGSDTATRATTVEAAPGGAATVDGSAVFLAKGCATCHAAPDVPSLTGIAPSLAGVAAWAGTRRPGMSAEDYLRQSVRDPGAFVSPDFVPTGPLAAMPGIAISDAELEAVVAYLLDDG